MTGIYLFILAGWTEDDNVICGLWGVCMLSSSSFPQPLETEIEGTEEPAPMFRLVLAGDAGAGKSSFLLRLTLNEFRGDIQTTLGGRPRQGTRC